MSVELDLMKGAVEFHTHSGPDLFPRYCDHADLARQYKAVGFKGLFIKSHTWGSADRIPFIRELVPDIDLFGTLVLSYANGGLNPFAVEAGIKFGARIIYMPCADAFHHRDFFSKSAGVNPQAVSGKQPPFKERAKGIKVLDENGKLLSEVYDILDLIAEANICLSMGHLSLEEELVLIPEAKKRGVSKIVIDHPNSPFTDVPFETQQKLAAEGVTMAYLFAEMSPSFFAIAPREMARRIKALGAGNVIMGTDVGQPGNTANAEAFRVFVRLMLDNGIAPEDIETMIKTNPIRLGYPD